ncbi:MAG: MoxR family ATPase [Cyanobacteria bacterium P01_D01_bin.50]
MSKRHIDTSTNFSLQDYYNLPESRDEIENPDIEPVPKENPATKEEKPPTKKVSKEPYLPNEKLVQAVNLAIALGRPLLLQGEPGCGKTSLAYAVSYGLCLPLEISYIKSTSRAQDLLYTYDAVNRLYDAELKDPRSQYIKNYIRLGPLGKAIARAEYGRRSVVLIDEIDKADLDFPNDLLWELDKLEFRVTEAPDIHYAVSENVQLRPIVIITHNEEKALPVAFLRRCIFHYVEFPQTEKELLEVLQLHDINNQELSQKAIKVLLKLRKLDLNKKPGLSELLDWVGYLQAVKTPIEELDKLPHIGALLKQQSDRQRAKEVFPES